jgi:hypothetical protein
MSGASRAANRSDRWHRRGWFEDAESPDVTCKQPVDFWKHLGTQTKKAPGSGWGL